MDNSSCLYEICVEGELGQQWSDWFSDMTVAGEGGREKLTTLTGYADQAALRGILNKLWDLNLILIAVRRIDERS
jgi:hypothetical protein